MLLWKTAEDISCNSKRGNDQVQNADYNPVIQHSILCVLMRSSPFLPMFHIG